MHLILTLRRKSTGRAVSYFFRFSSLRWISTAPLRDVVFTHFSLFMIRHHFSKKINKTLKDQLSKLTFFAFDGLHFVFRSPLFRDRNQSYTHLELDLQFYLAHIVFPLKILFSWDFGFKIEILNFWNLPTNPASQSVLIIRSSNLVPLTQRRALFAESRV